MQDSQIAQKAEWVERMEAEQRRAADREHRARIHTDIAAELTLCGLDSKQARAIVRDITRGFIPHLRIVYA